MKVSNKWIVTGDYAISDTDEEKSQLTHGGCGCCSSYSEVIEQEPVARLMAAAPEMLVLLRQLYKYGQDSVDATELLTRLEDIEFAGA